MPISRSESGSIHEAVCFSTSTRLRTSLELHYLLGNPSVPRKLSQKRRSDTRCGSMACRSNQSPHKEESLSLVKCIQPFCSLVGNQLRHSSCGKGGRRAASQSTGAGQLATVYPLPSLRRQCSSWRRYGALTCDHSSTVPLHVDAPNSYGLQCIFLSTVLGASERRVRKCKGSTCLLRPYSQACALSHPLTGKLSHSLPESWIRTRNHGTMLGGCMEIHRRQERGSFAAS